MRLEKTEIPNTCIPIGPEINRLVTTPITPIPPMTILTTPKRRPKVGALIIAKPRTMKLIVMNRLPTKNNVLVKPMVVCHKWMAVAFASGVAVGA